MDMVAKRVEVEIECVEGTVWAEFEKVLKGNLKTSRAWLVKENFCGLWEQAGRQQGAGSDILTCGETE